MAKWKVTATVQAKGNPPVDMVWQKEGSEMGAMVSVAQLFKHDEEYLSEENNIVPFPELLAVKIEKVA